MTAMLGRLVVACVLVTALSRAAFADEGWGNLRGQFVFDGPALKPIEINTFGKSDRPIYFENLLVDSKTRGIANIVIYARGKDLREHADYLKSIAKEVPLEAKNLRLEPHVLVTRVGQSLRIKSGGGCNLNFSPPGSEAISPLIRTDRIEKLERPYNIPLPVGCNVHPWIRCYVVIRPNAYVAVTGIDGAFEIKNLPADTLEFQVWHEDAGYLVARPQWTKGQFKQAIRAGETVDLGVIKVSPSLFRPETIERGTTGLKK